MQKYPKKPSPELVYMIMDKRGCSKEQTVYIGDSDVDIMTARNAGTDCIAVEWGFRSREFLLEHGAETIVSDVSSLERLLTENPQ
jgi:phosphoglycolate phosphatase